MFTPDQYQLLDFGEGRRLETFGPWRLDRPCPAAETLNRSAPDAWASADARFERTGAEQGEWITAGDTMPKRWTISHGQLRFELKRSEFGHVGLFPEQAANWDWIAREVVSAGRTLKILNLFAYTGGSTLAAAAAGAEVVHVDAARNTVGWARRNAELSDLAEAPVRWIGEDAMKFVKREHRRGNRYDAVVLDPPSYGHGPRGEVWRLAKHLPQLLAWCAALLDGRGRFLLLTCHTPGFTPERLGAMTAEALGPGEAGAIPAETLRLQDAGGRFLPSGVVVRWGRGTV